MRQQIWRVDFDDSDDGSEKPGLRRRGDRLDHHPATRKASASRYIIVSIGIGALLVANDPSGVAMSSEISSSERVRTQRLSSNAISAFTTPVVPRYPSRCSITRPWSATSAIALRLDPAGAGTPRKLLNTWTPQALSIQPSDSCGWPPDWVGHTGLRVAWRQM